MTHPYVIERPDRQALAQRYGSAWVTLGFWLLYLYLWTPIVTLLAWTLQVGLARHEMIERQGYLALIDSMGSFGLVILVIFLLLIGWAEYNYQRFRGVDRRDAAKVITTENLADYFDVPLVIADAWQRAKTLNIHLDEQGRIVPSSAIRERMARIGHDLSKAHAPRQHLPATPPARGDSTEPEQR